MSTANTNFNQVCFKCHGSIDVIENVIECNNCKCKYHKTCSKKQTSLYRHNAYCNQCLKVKAFDIIKYNPFYDTIKTSADDANKPYLNNVISHDTIETLSSLSMLLENCTTEYIESLNENFKSHNEQKHEKSVSFKFLNKDGNASNFDSLATSLHAISLKFSAIGIAETNIDPSVQCTYQIPNYNSIYQNKMSGKKKGSGRGLYIHESLTYTKNDAFSILSDDIETLLVSIVNNSTPLILGIVYRPPSSSLKNFNEIFSKILSSIKPSNNTIIMGDFNINLLKNNEHSSSFEENILRNGFSPVISTPTHHKPNCQATCIDNILVNNHDKVLRNGT